MQVNNDDDNGEVEEDGKEVKDTGREKVIFVFVLPRKVTPVLDSDALRHLYFVYKLFWRYC